MPNILESGYLAPSSQLPVGATQKRGGIHNYVFFTLITPDNKIDFTLNERTFLDNTLNRVYMIFNASMLEHFNYTWWPYWMGGSEHYRMDRNYKLRQNLNLVYNYLRFDNCYMEESNMHCNEFMIPDPVPLSTMNSIYYPMRLLDDYVCIAEKHQEYARYIWFHLENYINDKNKIANLMDIYPDYRWIVNTKNSFLKKYVKLPDSRFVVILPHRVLGNAFWSDRGEIEREADYQERMEDKEFYNFQYKNKDCVR